MLAYTLFQPSSYQLNETELFSKIQIELANRYSIDPRLASEMAWDLVEVLTAINGDVEIFEKYFLH
jgi:hypothetical protein